MANLSVDDLDPPRLDVIGVWAGFTAAAFTAGLAGAVSGLTGAVVGLSPAAPAVPGVSKPSN